MGTGGGPLPPDPEDEQQQEEQEEQEEQQEPLQRTVTLTLQVDLEDLTDQNQTQIRDQITNLINSLGGSDPTFDDFEAGSTKITVTSATPFNVTRLKDAIKASDNSITITYTHTDGTTRSTFITNIGDENTEDEPVEYDNDIIIVKTDNTKIYGVVGNDGIVTRKIINDLIGNTEEDRNTIQCVLFGGKTTGMADGDTTQQFVPGGNPPIQTLPNDDVIFPFCTNLHTINFGNVTKVGDYAFYGCNTLTQIDFKSVNTIGEGSFTECESLVNIDFKNVKEIGGTAFANCKEIVSIDLKNVNEISLGSFFGCTGLREVNIGLVEVIPGQTFWFCGGIEIVRVNKNLTGPVGQFAFDGSPVVTEDNEANPFLLANGINAISFEGNNGEFSNKSIGDNSGDLMLVDYPPDTNYKRVTIRP